MGNNNNNNNNASAQCRIASDSLKVASFRSPLTKLENFPPLVFHWAQAAPSRYRDRSPCNRPIRYDVVREFWVD